MLQELTQSDKDLIDKILFLGSRYKIPKDEPDKSFGIDDKDCREK